MKKLILIKTLFFFIAVNFLAIDVFGQNCKELVVYRDVKLVQVYDEALQNSVKLTTATIDFKKIKTDLLDETKWVASDWSLLVGMIAATFKTTADLTNNLLKFTPQGQVVGAGASSADFLYNALKVGGDVKKLVTNGSEKFVAEKIVAKAGPLGQALLTIKNFADNVATITALPEDHTQLKKDLKDAIEGLEKEIIAVDSAIKDSNSKLALINEYKNGIDRYLNEECVIKRANSAEFNTPSVSYTITGKYGSCTFKFNLQKVQIVSQFDKANRTFSSFAIKLTRSNSTAQCVNIQPVLGKALKVQLSMASQSQSNDTYTVNLPVQPRSPAMISAVFIGKLQADRFNGRITFYHPDWTSSQNVVLLVTP